MSVEEQPVLDRILIFLGTVAHKISIQRATTVSPKSPLCNVVVRNTSLEKDVQAPVNAVINRSQSLLATKGRVPVLAPSRGDRARLEALLSDVWTREILPFPGMTVRARNEHLIRTSAHSMIRKLSVTSITSQFTKRSASLASVTRGGSDDESIGDDITPVLTSPLPGTSDTEPALGNLFDQESGCSTRLSVINDDSDCTPSTLRFRNAGRPVSSTASMRNPRSPRRRMRIAKSPSTWQLGSNSPHLSVSPSPSTPVALRTRSPNGPQVSRQTSRLSSRKSMRSMCSSIDGGGRGARHRKAAAEMGQLDGAVDHLEDEKRSSSPLPSSTSPNKSGANRWPRVEMLRRGTMAQGIRGFFR